MGMVKLTMVRTVGQLNRHPLCRDSRCIVSFTAYRCPGSSGITYVRGKAAMDGDIHSEVFNSHLV